MSGRAADERSRGSLTRRPWWRDVRAFDLEVAARAAIAAVVPLAILVGIGQVELAPYAAFGGMTAIFGRGEAYRARIRTASIAAVALVASVSVGVVVAVAGGAGALGEAAAVPLTAVALVIVLVVGVLTVNVARLGPPTPLFFVFAVLVCASVPTPAEEAWLRIGVAAAAAVFAWALSLSGWVLRRAVSRPGASASAPVRATRDTLSSDNVSAENMSTESSPSENVSSENVPTENVSTESSPSPTPAKAGSVFKPLRAAAPIRWAALRDAAVWRTIAQHVVAGLVAGALALALGIGHPYWAVVSVAAVIPPAGAAHSVSRAWHRVFGTVAGVVVTWLILLPDPPVWVLVLVVAVAQFGAEVFVGRHYGVALVFITPLALVVAHLGQPVPVGTLLVDRVVETVLGCAVAILAVLAARALTRRAA